MEKKPAAASENKTRQKKAAARTLDLVIVVCVVAILLVFVLEMRDPGLIVTFDSKGGTDVPAQTQSYGELLELPEPPSREGYTFTGWYTDTACFDLWDTEEMKIESDLTLYAGWKVNE